MEPTHITQILQHCINLPWISRHEIARINMIADDFDGFWVVSVITGKSDRGILSEMVEGFFRDPNIKKSGFVFEQVWVQKTFGPQRLWSIKLNVYGLADFLNSRFSKLFNIDVLFVLYDDKVRSTNILKRLFVPFVHRSLIVVISQAFLIFQMFVFFSQLPRNTRS